jgi:hypothetical protein
MAAITIGVRNELADLDSLALGVHRAGPDAPRPAQGPTSGERQGPTLAARAPQQAAALVIAHRRGVVVVPSLGGGRCGMSRSRRERHCDTGAGAQRRRQHCRQGSDQDRAVPPAQPRQPARRSRAHGAMLSPGRGARVNDAQSEWFSFARTYRANASRERCQRRVTRMTIAGERSRTTMWAASPSLERSS